MEIPQENQIDLHKTYKLAEALPLVRNVEKRKFSQSIDIVIVLRGIDTKKPENKFSKDVVLPHGRGKDVSVFVMDENNFYKIMLAAAIVLVIASVFLMMQTPQVSQSQSKITDNTDICAVPLGQDPVAWKEHLSHHPDTAAKCLS